MLVYFLRHASAGQSRANPAQDNQRPLDKTGIEQCRDVGRLLAAIAVEVDVIISSPLKRATETAALVAKEIGHNSKIALDAALGSGATFPKFRRLLRHYAGKKAVMVVGHNPSLSEFLSLLVTNGKSSRATDMKKGAIARVEYEGNQPLLSWMVTPKIARASQSAKAARSRPKSSRK